nr:Transposon Tf2-12 polyprotein [Ipomoea batatas]
MPAEEGYPTAEASQSKDESSLEEAIDDSQSEEGYWSEEESPSYIDPPPEEASTFRESPDQEEVLTATREIQGGLSDIMPTNLPTQHPPELKELDEQRDESLQPGQIRQFEAPYDASTIFQKEHDARSKLCPDSQALNKVRTSQGLEPEMTYHIRDVGMRPTLVWLSEFVHPEGPGQIGPQKKSAQHCMHDQDSHQERICYEGRADQTWMELAGAQRRRYSTHTHNIRGLSD